MEHPICAGAHDLVDSLASVACTNPTFMHADEKAAALVELAEVEARVCELRLRVLAAADDVAEQTGARDAAAWVAHATHSSGRDARADLRLAFALERRPVLGAAFRTGLANRAQAGVIARALDELPDDLAPDTIKLAEKTLVAEAEHHDPAALLRLGRRILDVVAPEIAEAVEARHLANLEASAEARMRLGLRSMGDGTTRISGLLPDADAARLATYLHAFTNPRRDEAGVQVRSTVPYGHRAARAFCQFLETVDPTRLPVHGGDATALVVTMTLDSLRSELGAATLGTPAPDGADRITATQARRLACNAQIIPAVLNGVGEVLDLGRAQRLFSRAQRKALLIRDSTCRAEGCDIPGTWSEAHHLVPWSHGGATDLANAVLLCNRHHHRIHDPAYDHRRLANGDLRFHRRR